MASTIKRAAVAAALASAALAPAAEAGPFLAPQIFTAGSQRSESFDLAVAPNGASAVVYRSLIGTTGCRALSVAVRGPGAAPSAAAPRGFSPGEIVTPTDGTPILSAAVGVDAAGNTTVVYWLGDSYDPGATVYTRYRPAGGAWTAPQALSKGANSYSTPSGVFVRGLVPKIVVAPDGRALILTDAGVFDRAPSETQFTAVPGTADIWQIDVNAAGDVAATTGVARLGDEQFLELGVTTRPVGGSFAAVRPLGTVGIQYEPQRSAIAITANGTVVVPWVKLWDSVNVETRTPGASFATGTWSTTEHVNVDWPVEERYDVSAAAESATKVAVGWRQRDELFDVERREQLFPGSAPSSIVPIFDPAAVSPAAKGRALGVDPYANVIGASGDLRVRVRPKSGDPFGPVQNVLPAPGAYESYVTTDAALDDQGNGYLFWTHRLPDGGGTAGVSGYDPVAPLVTAVRAGAAKASKPVVLSAVATDRMSVPTFTWVFGDGTAAARGATVVHTYARAGTYTAKVTARDEAGNTASWPKTIVVADAAAAKQ